MKSSFFVKCVCMASKSKTRAGDTYCKIFGCSLDEEKDIKLFSSRFPSYKEVSLCLLASRNKYCKQNQTSGWKHQAKEDVYSQLMVHTKKCNIQIMSRGGVFNKLDKILKDFELERKNYSRKGSVSTGCQLLRNLIKQLYF